VDELINLQGSRANPEDIAALNESLELYEQAVDEIAGEQQGAWERNLARFGELSRPETEAEEPELDVEEVEGLDADDIPILSFGGEELLEPDEWDVHISELEEEEEADEMLSASTPAPLAPSLSTLPDAQQMRGAEAFAQQLSPRYADGGLPAMAPPQPAPQYEMAAPPEAPPTPPPAPPPQQHPAPQAVPQTAPPQTEPPQGVPSGEAPPVAPASQAPQYYPIPVQPFEPAGEEPAGEEPAAEDAAEQMAEEEVVEEEVVEEEAATVDELDLEEIDLSSLDEELEEVEEEAPAEDEAEADDEGSDEMVTADEMAGLLEDLPEGVEEETIEEFEDDLDDTIIEELDEPEEQVILPDQLEPIPEEPIPPPQPPAVTIIQQALERPRTTPEQTGPLLDYLSDLATSLPAGKRSEFLASDAHMKLEYLRARFSGQRGLHSDGARFGAEARPDPGLRLTKQKVADTLDYISNISGFLPDAAIGSALQKRVSLVTERLRQLKEGPGDL